MHKNVHFSKPITQENEENVEIITLQNINDIADSSNEGELYNPEIGKPLREQDRFLPIANISKIMKKSIPDGVKVGNNINNIFIIF